MNRTLCNLFLFLFILIGSVKIFGQERILASDIKILSTFFKSILEHEAGYVLYDQKPLCCMEYFQNPFYFEPKEYRQRSVNICVAKCILEQPIFHSGNIIFHYDEKGEVLLIINKKKFLETVKDSLILFQYVLGPTITPELLLEKMCSPHYSFFETLNYDRVLIGIVLGYGVQNSLFVSRLENISNDFITIEDIPPFLPTFAQYANESLKEDLLIYDKSPIPMWSKKRSFLNPSYGFASLEQEMKTIETNMDFTPDDGLGESPYFIFGYLKDSEKNKALLKELELTQKKIRILQQSPNLVRDVLALISDREIAIEENDAVYPFQAIDVDLNIALAKLLKSSVSDYQKTYLQQFILGLQGLIDEDDLCGPILPAPNVVATLQNAKLCVQEADLFFEALEEDTSVLKISEPYLYYSVLTEGEGPVLQGDTEILVSYEIFNPTDQCLNSERCTRLDLKKVLPAFAHGVQGMKMGEKRVIFIHPSLGYGVYTFLEKGIFLKAVVTLHNIYGSKQALPELNPVDLSFILENSFQQKCEEDHKRALRFMGNQKKEFLETCLGINLDQILKAFQSIENISNLTQEESDALNRFFWTMYYSPTRNIAKAAL